jgi:hypothetical protein
MQPLLQLLLFLCKVLAGTAVAGMLVFLLFMMIVTVFMIVTLLMTAEPQLTAREGRRTTTTTREGANQQSAIDEFGTWLDDAPMFMPT